MLSWWKSPFAFWLHTSYSSWGCGTHFAIADIAQLRLCFLPFNPDLEKQFINYLKAIHVKPTEAGFRASESFSCAATVPTQGATLVTDTILTISSQEIKHISRKNWLEIQLYVLKKVAENKWMLNNLCLAKVKALTVMEWNLEGSAIRVCRLFEELIYEISLKNASISVVVPAVRALTVYLSTEPSEQRN